MATLDEKSMRAMSYIEGILEAIEQYGDEAAKVLASKMNQALVDIYKFEGYNFDAWKNKDVHELNTVIITKRNGNQILYKCSDGALEKIVALLNETEPTVEEVSGRKKKGNK